MHSYWHKQTDDNPLFPELDWEKPERRDMAGKILIIGGSSFSFSGVAEAYENVLSFGIGEVRVLLPDSLKKITAHLKDITYAESNSVGSFSAKAIMTALNMAQWADTVLLNGEYGRNSETSVMLANLIQSYKGQVCLTKDAIDILSSDIRTIANRESSTLVCSYSQLQKLCKDLNWSRAFKFSDDLIRVVENLHELTLEYAFTIITKHDKFLIAAHGGEVITNRREDLNELWCLRIASLVAVNLTQHSTKQLGALAHTLLS